MNIAESLTRWLAFSVSLFGDSCGDGPASSGAGRLAFLAGEGAPPARELGSGLAAHQLIRRRSATGFIQSDEPDYACGFDPAFGARISPLRKIPGHASTRLDAQRDARRQALANNKSHSLRF